MQTIPLSELFQHYTIRCDDRGLPRIYCDRCKTWGGAPGWGALTAVMAEVAEHEANVHA